MSEKVVIWKGYRHLADGRKVSVVVTFDPSKINGMVYKAVYNAGRKSRLQDGMIEVKVAPAGGGS